MESAAGIRNGEQDKQECGYCICVQLAFSAVEFSFSPICLAFLSIVVNVWRQYLKSLLSI